MSEGRKDDSGKVRMELLPPELLEATATILTFGAQKYTSVHVFSNQEAVSWIQELLQSSFPQYAIRIDASIAEGCAETAMNGSFGPTTQSMRRGSAKIDENGGAETLIGLEPWKIDARLALRPGSVIDGQNGPLGCGSTASPQKGLNASSSLRAGSVRSATE